MIRRLTALLRARIALVPDGGIPWAGLAMQFLLAGVLCSVAADVLPTYAYAFFALSVGALLLALPLTGEAGALFFVDEARDWLFSQPARPMEIHVARRVHGLGVLGILSLGSLLPAVVFAPNAMDSGQRVLLVLLGLGQALFLTACFLSVLSVLRGRAGSLLVILQTAIFAALFGGAIVGMQHLMSLAEVRSLANLPELLSWLPSAQFAGPLGEVDLHETVGSTSPLTPLILVGLGVLLIAFTPSPDLQGSQELGTRDRIGILLAPLRRLAERFWVRDTERAGFHFVFDALPREREFALRSYPLIGVPLALFLLGAKGGDSAPVSGSERDALLALFLFLPAAYLPLLLVQVPASRWFSGRWLMDTSPTAPQELHNGALKAVSVRFILPLYLALTILAITLAGPASVPRFVLPALFFALIWAQRSWSLLVEDLPLSCSPEELKTGNELFGMMMGIGALATILAVVFAKQVLTPSLGWLATLAFAALWWFGQRSATRHQ